jgi:hypothetical protein
MMSSKFARRKARGGRGLIPPNTTQWENEHNGLDLREDLSLGTEACLDIPGAFRLYPGVTILAHGQVPMAAKFVEHFRREGQASWSGLSLTLDEDHELVLYNDAHPESRVRATLMEEFFHLRLAHPRSVVRFFGSTDKNRTFDGAMESAAYGSGAAALVPYCALRAMLRDGVTIAQIAKHFLVSPELVRFRMKVTKLYASRRVH